MKTRSKIVVAGLVLLLLALAYWWKQREAGLGGGGSSATDSVQPLQTPPSSLPASTTTLTVLPLNASHPSVAKTSAASGGAGSASSSGKPLRPSPPATPDVLPPPKQPQVIEVPAGQEGMRRDLIPRGITIVRCYYTEEVVNPGTQFYFDINGTGFDTTFRRMIRVDTDALDVEVQNLELITANQIRGLMVVGEAATTQYIYPKILIRGLPVFKAPEPFGVVRSGEVLDIQLTSINESGQWGQFRVITNLDSGLYSKLRIDPTTPRLEVSGLKPKLPFYVDGTIEIAPGLSSGSYGLKASIGTREIFRKQPVVEVVKPNVGKTGSVEKIEAKEVANRPGDTALFTIKGSGFTSSQQPNLTAEVPGLSIPPAVFSYVSQGQYELSLAIPGNAPTGVYGLKVQHKGRLVYEKKSAFVVVPTNWLSSIHLAQPLSPGQKGQIQLSGRDVTADFAQTLSIQVDEPGLVLSPLQWQDPRTITATLDVSETVAPGDYILHVYSGNKELKLPRGNIIKIGATP